MATPTKEKKNNKSMEELGITHDDYKEIIKRKSSPVPEGCIRKRFTIRNDQLEFAKSLRRETGITPEELIQIALDVIMADSATHLSDAIGKATIRKLLKLTIKSE